MTKHSLVAHVETGGFGLFAPDCPRCEEESREGIELAHLVKGDGTCIISMNGQGHFPCDQHFTHRDGKQCWRVSETEWATKYTTDAPEVWTDEGEEPPTSQPCARAHVARGE